MITSSRAALGTTFSPYPVGGYTTAFAASAITADASKRARGGSGCPRSLRLGPDDPAPDAPFYFQTDFGFR